MTCNDGPIPEDIIKGLAVAFEGLDSKDARQRTRTRQMLVPCTELSPVQLIFRMPQLLGDIYSLIDADRDGLIVPADVQ